MDTSWTPERVRKPAAPGELAELADVQRDAGGQCRNYSWTESFLGSMVEQGAAKVGVVGFGVPDTEKATSSEVCGPTKQAEVDTDEFPCVPIKAPSGT
ncbi:hypothetical protein [Streptomyces sp. NPDC059994]|uniref:hypothetical protein n=1 Tax=Streptomyces sp. NPDC059994 TaxID=3347029 RepID=UPI0036AD5924